MRYLIIVCEVLIHLVALKAIIGFRFPWEGKIQEEKTKKYLDESILVASQARDDVDLDPLDEMRAQNYIDAFQSVRMMMFGENYIP